MIHISMIVWALCSLQSVSAFAADPEPTSANMVSASFAPEASSEDMEWVICNNGWCPDGFSCKRSGEECKTQGWLCSQHYECLSAVCLPGAPAYSTPAYPVRFPRVCL